MNHLTAELKKTLNILIHLGLLSSLSKCTFEFIVNSALAQEFLRLHQHVFFNFLFVFIIFIFIYLFGYFGCIYICALCVQCLQRTEGVRSPGIRVTGGYEQSCGIEHRSSSRTAGVVSLWGVFPFPINIVLKVNAFISQSNQLFKTVTTNHQVMWNSKKSGFLIHNSFYLHEFSYKFTHWLEVLWTLILIEIILIWLRKNYCGTYIVVRM